jgi:Prokaryotic dksA/traR C4-type zinc finger
MGIRYRRDDDVLEEFFLAILGSRPAHLRPFRTEARGGDQASGEPIPDERLDAVPTAERTVEEQTHFERQAR